MPVHGDRLTNRSLEPWALPAILAFPSRNPAGLFKGQTAEPQDLGDNQSAMLFPSIKTGENLHLLTVASLLKV